MSGALCAALYLAKPNRAGAGEKNLVKSGIASKRYDSGMALKEVIALIDAEIATLKEVVCL